MKLRVVQWTTGIVGQSAVRALLAHPELELVGCYSWSSEKAGKDVGELCGIDPIGVVATDNIDDVIALHPDVCLYMPLAWVPDDMVRLLESGINVISTANFITGHSYGDEEMQRLDDAAKRGDVSLFGSGINPGYANALGLMATALCRRIDRVSVLESVDCTPYASPQSWLDCGFAGPPDAPGLDEKVKNRTLVFLDAVEMMANALGIELDEIVFTPEFGVATEDLDLGYMKIDRGTVCGLKATWGGKAGGKRVIDLGLMWRLGNAMEPDWPVEDGYVIQVDGDPSVRCKLTAKFSEGASDFGMPTANPAVNAIFDVVAAKPGLVTADELPLPKGAGFVDLT